MADGCKVWHPHNTTSSSGGSEDKSVGKQVMCASDPSPPQQTMERKKTQVWDNRQLGLQSNPDTVWVLVHHDMGEVGVQVLDRCHLGAIKHRLGLVPLSADRLTYWPLWFSTRQLWFPQVPLCFLHNAVWFICTPVWFLSKSVWFSPTSFRKDDKGYLG
uniref:Uncharacterized protein n=1 Tax=Helianthus annuus TaxID=4232 RepID=A0A251RXC9_HELAN